MERGTDTIFVLLMHTFIRSSGDTWVAFKNFTIRPLIIKFLADVDLYIFRDYGGSKKICTC